MSFYIYETTVEEKGDVGMTETELLQKITVKTTQNDRNYHPEEVFQLLEMTRRMKSALELIVWKSEATSPQSMIMKDIARKGLYEK